ncbi:MAG: hypothetical protein SGCHY_002739, partial [Lobulomycetales sp.]
KEEEQDANSPLQKREDSDAWFGRGYGLGYGGGWGGIGHAGLGYGGLGYGGLGYGRGMFYQKEDEQK